MREPGAMGKASHGGHRGHGGGIVTGSCGASQRSRGRGWWTKFFCRGGFGARTKRNWESIAQRSRRGIGLVDEVSSAEGRLRCEDQAQRGKHRTEVTEGIGVGGRNFFCGGAASVREPGATGKASHGGHRGHRGGLGWWTTWATVVAVIM